MRFFKKKIFVMNVNGMLRVNLILLTIVIENVRFKTINLTKTVTNIGTGK